MIRIKWKLKSGGCKVNIIRKVGVEDSLMNTIERLIQITRAKIYLKTVEKLWQSFRGEEKNKKNCFNTSDGNGDTTRNDDVA